MNYPTEDIETYEWADWNFTLGNENLLYLSIMIEINHINKYLSRQKIRSTNYKSQI